VAIAHDIAHGSALGSTVQQLTVARQEFRVDIRTGTGSGAPLLMYSGIGAGLELFQPLVDAIDPAIEVIRVDTPGVGGSPAALRPYTFHELAWMMSRLLDQLGYGRVDVLGYSWGGALAQQFALQHASRCRRLVLLSTSTGTLSVPGDLRALAGLMMPPDMQIPGLTLRPETLFRTTGRERRSDMSTLLAALEGDGTGRGYLHQLAALGTWTSLPFLPLLSQPVLVMSGDDDPIVPPSNARLMAKLLPDSTLEMFAGGHMEIISSADKLGWTISRFLAPVPPV
jgi:poly(3-hydroxyalkanoate) depolymerase